jgi:hypothetical protein
MDKGTLTEDELILISRYQEDIQDRLKEELLKAKEMPKSFKYVSWIEHLEQGLEITFKDNTTWIGKLNTPRLARLLLEINDGVKRKPTIPELQHDGRLEAFKQYPKGTRVKANGEVVY